MVHYAFASRLNDFRELEVNGSWETVRYHLEKKFGMQTVKPSVSKYFPPDHLRGFHLHDFREWKKQRATHEKIEQEREYPCIEDFWRTLPPTIEETHMLNKTDCIVLIRCPTPSRIGPYIPNSFLSEEERIALVTNNRKRQLFRKINRRKLGVNAHASNILDGTGPKPHKKYKCRYCNSNQHYLINCPKYIFYKN